MFLICPQPELVDKCTVTRNQFCEVLSVQTKALDTVPEQRLSARLLAPGQPFPCSLSNARSPPAQLYWQHQQALNVKINQIHQKIGRVVRLTNKIQGTQCIFRQVFLLVVLCTYTSFQDYMLLNWSSNLTRHSELHLATLGRGPLCDHSQPSQSQCFESAVGRGPWLLSQVEERTKETGAGREEWLLQTEACFVQTDI